MKELMIIGNTSDMKIPLIMFLVITVKVKELLSQSITLLQEKTPQTQTMWIAKCVKAKEKY